MGDLDATLEWIGKAASVSTAAAPFLYINTKVFDSMRQDATFNRSFEEIESDIWRRVNTPPLVRQ